MCEERDLPRGVFAQDSTGRHPRQQGQPGTAGPAHPGMGTQAVGCFACSQGKVALHKRGHSGRKPGASVEVEPHTPNPTPRFIQPLGSVKGNNQLNEMTAN